MADDEYILAPKQELEELKAEVARLKGNPLGNAKEATTLLEAVNKLNASILKLNEILEGANEDMVKAFHDTSVQEQLRLIVEQNEKLAHGIVSVAESVKKLEPHNPFEEHAEIPLPKRS